MGSYQSCSKEGTVRHCQLKEASILWSHHEETRSWLEKEIMQGTMSGAGRWGRPCSVWMDNIKTWTGLPVEESIRMTENRDKWRKYVHRVANPRIEVGQKAEQKIVFRTCIDVYEQCMSRMEESGRTFSILSSVMLIDSSTGVLSTSWCCPSRPCVVFLACVHLALFLALSLSPGSALQEAVCCFWLFLVLPENVKTS